MTVNELYFGYPALTDETCREFHELPAATVEQMFGFWVRGLPPNTTPVLLCFAPDGSGIVDPKDGNSPLIVVPQKDMIRKT